MDDIRFKPTTDWMDKKYNEFNEKLFMGSLGECIFNVSPVGGKVLGRFQVTADNLYINRWTRQLYLQNSYGDITRKNVNYSNFFDLARPMITLNGNYSATEEAWENTLVHEMCHYYTYKNGYIPKQGHGTEFRRIAQLVALRSHDRFTIQRLATSEEMENYTLDQKEQEKIDKRLKNKLANITVVLVYRQDGAVEMTLTKKPELVREIIRYITEHPSVRSGFKYCKVGRSEELTQLLLKYNYKKTQNTYRFYSIQGKPILNDLNNVNFQETYYPKQSESGALEEEGNNILSHNEASLKINPNWNLGLFSPLEMV